VSNESTRKVTIAFFWRRGEKEGKNSEEMETESFVTGGTAARRWRYHNIMIKEGSRSLGSWANAYSGSKGRKRVEYV